MQSNATVTIESAAHEALGIFLACMFLHFVWVAADADGNLTLNRNQSRIQGCCCHRGLVMPKKNPISDVRFSAEKSGTVYANRCILKSSILHPSIYSRAMSQEPGFWLERLSSHWQ
jgi:hypothetical protein